MSQLFNKTTIGNIDVNNRVFMAPLTRNRAKPDGVPGNSAALYYKQRAGAGLILTEATQISPIGKGYLNTPGIYTPAHIQGWKEITEAVHAEGGKMFIQLWHVGRISHTSLLPDGEIPVSASAIQAHAQTYTQDGMVSVSEPRAMTIEDIQQTVQDYKAAADSAKEAGFDGIEIHSANGYLLDQFLQDKTNKRDDRYGGAIENKMLFLLEVIEAVCDVWSPQQVGVRLSPTGAFNDMGDSNPKDNFGAVIKKLNEYNLGYLHMVERFPGIENSESDEAIIRDLRDLWQGFYIANGEYNRQSAINAVESGYADAIAFGRPYIANPDLAQRLEKNTDLNTPDQTTFYGGGEKGYTDYPFLEDLKTD